MRQEFSNTLMYLTLIPYLLNKLHLMKKYIKNNLIMELNWPRFCLQLSGPRHSAPGTELCIPSRWGTFSWRDRSRWVWTLCRARTGSRRCSGHLWYNTRPQDSSICLCRQCNLKIRMKSKSLFTRLFLAHKQSLQCL